MIGNLTIQKLQVLLQEMVDKGVDPQGIRRGVRSAEVIQGGHARGTAGRQ